MPIDGDNGFFPTTGNELVGFSLSHVLLWSWRIVSLTLMYYAETRSSQFQS